MATKKKKKNRTPYDADNFLTCPEKKFVFFDNDRQRPRNDFFGPKIVRSDVLSNDFLTTFAKRQTAKNREPFAQKVRGGITGF